MAAEPQPTPAELDPDVIRDILRKATASRLILSQFNTPCMCKLGDVDSWEIVCNVAVQSETHRLLTESHGKGMGLQTLARLSRNRVDAGPDCVMVVTAPVKPTSTGLQDPRFRASTNDEAAKLLMRTLVSILRWIHGAQDGS